MYYTVGDEDGGKGEGEQNAGYQAEAGEGGLEEKGKGEEGGEEE